MPSEIMDQRSLSPSSYFYEEIRLPVERQVGFWNPETMHDHHGVGMDGMSRTPRNKSIASSPLEKLVPVGAQSMEYLDFPQHCLAKDQKARLSLERHVVGAERTTNPSMPSWRSIDHDLGTRSNTLAQSASYSVERSKVDMEAQHENGLFSSTLSEIFSKKLRLSSNDVLFGESVNAVPSQYEDEEPFESLEEMEAHTIGNLLPDDDDLLFGVIEGLDYIAQPNGGDNIEDFDLFSSVGGMELEVDDNLSCSVGQKDTNISGGISNCQQGELNGSIIGEHPYGEHPSRTLFVRNINSNIEDSELRALFEQYGDIRTLYTACKHRGFVMISYYDIRAACNAMRSLQNKPLRRRKLDIHFSIPKDNPSEKDTNQGTLVVFNLDSSVSNDEICQIFGVYGDIKEIGEIPHKRHYKFIEFYDVRSAESALRALNRSDIAGKQIKLETGRPGGDRCLMQQFSPELEQEESSAYRQQESPPIKSPSVCFGPVSHGAITSSCMENRAVHGLHSAIGVPISHIMENGFHHGISPSVPQSLPSPVRVAPVVNHSGLGEPHHALGQTEFGFQRMPNCYPRSLPEYHDASGIPYNSLGSVAANVSPRPSGSIDSRHVRRVGLNGHSVELIEGGFGSSGNGSFPLHGHQYVWSNSNSFNHHSPSPMMWPNLPSFVNGVLAHPPPQLHGLPRVPSHMLNTVLPRHHHHVGSAPSINPSLWDRRRVYAGESPETSGFHAGSLGSGGLSGSTPLHPLELASHNIFPRVGGNCMDTTIASTDVGLHSPQQRCHMFLGRNPMIPMSNSFYGSNEQVRSRRNDISTNLTDNKKQYELDIDCILRGEDTRTTLMIKNIPNKYTSKMLLAAIDERHRGTYDFIYLPIDFKNKCNVGYAFINMINPLHIIPFYQAFNGKKWEKFNSEKVASLAYARIQGKAALIAHFQNSSLMNEDKRCRPILFHSDGPNAGDQEPFPMGFNIRSRPGKSQTNGSEENRQGSPSISANGEESSNGNGMDGSSKDSE